MIESEQFKTEPDDNTEEKVREVQGNDHARNELAMRIYEELNLILRRYLRRSRLLLDAATDIEDILQETWIKVFKHLTWAPFPNGQHVRAWMMTIARNTMVDYLRRAKRRSRLSQDNIKHLASSVDPGATEPSDILGRREDIEMVRRAIEALPDVDQEVIRLYLFERMTSFEAGEKLSISPMTVRQKFFRADREVLPLRN